ncbi:outer membrane receptor protein involved in Fe transport [Sphingomonas jinjuensis]|uniref:Outer membrane receptor protein involved in Fe transport n=1 Tax=Sphingomonas jinjuensis TaxID=535907 RepID=A0A840FNQ3_9SPHN|nr:TonB-dependent receptor [Sphingomonas jinjuensis]MBB4154915.1 outer membrane receptor protein involved in Fe transport [Sphingomonas jinjuensis]
MIYISRRPRALTSVSALALSLVAIPAAAQTAEQAANPPGQTVQTSGEPQTSSAEAQGPDQATGTDIVVTGSRIARPEFETLQPTQVIGATQIANRGYTNVGQALQEIPAFGPPGNSGVGGQSSFGPSQTFVDFFGLGSQRTLVLVNGRRFVSSNTASIFGPVAAGTQVDLNNIPTTLIDRVETVAIGGAPIYGSDAIAGTVNIILKRNYEGLQIQGQTGVSEQGDAPDYRISILAGKNFAGGRGNITISGEYNKVTGLTAGDREITRQGNFFGTPPAAANSQFQRLLYPAQRYSAFTIGGVPFNDDDFSVQRAGIKNPNAPGQYLQFGPNGTLVPLDLGTVLRQGYISSGGNGFDLPAQSNLLTNSERYLASVQASFQLTDNIRVFGEGWYVHSKGVNLIDQPNYNTGLFDAAGTADGNIIVSLNNPYLSAADRATIAAQLPAGQNQFYLGRALADLTTGRAEATVETYRFVGGFDGSFGALGREFKWEATAVYGRSQTDGRNFELVQQNFQNAINPVRDASGNITCAPGAVSASIPTINPTCAPLNILGSNQASQAARDYIFAIATPRSVNEQLVFNANVNGPVFTLFGNDVSVSAGYEHREEKTRFDPGAYYFGEPQADGTRQQYGRSIPIDPVRGKFHTNEVFGELVIPFVSDKNGLSWLHTVEFDGAARYVDNSLSGGALTWTAGGRIGFIPDITFRGNFTRSIRSPAITEVFNPTSRAFDVGSDPCDTRYVGNGPNPATRAANCRAAGINTADFTSNFSDFTIPVTIAGNSALRNEVADSWTVGAIIQPRFARSFSLAVDWVNIKLKDAITSLDGTSILNACYDSPGYPNQFCSSFDRGADGQITTIREGYFNAASYEVRGLTVTAAYRLPLSRIGLGDNAGALGLSGNYFYRDRLQTQVGTGDINYDAGEIGYPRHSGTANLTYDSQVFNLLFQGRYIGKSRYDLNEAPNARNIPGVGDWWVFNTTLGIKAADNFDLRFIVDNVFNAKPPYPVPAGGGTTTYFSGILGRYFRVSATARF